MGPFRPPIVSENEAVSEPENPSLWSLRRRPSRQPRFWAFVTHAVPPAWQLPPRRVTPVPTTPAWPFACETHASATRAPALAPAPVTTVPGGGRGCREGQGDQKPSHSAHGLGSGQQRAWPPPFGAPRPWGTPATSHCPGAEKSPLGTAFTYQAPLRGQALLEGGPSPYRGGTTAACVFKRRKQNWRQTHGWQVVKPESVPRIESPWP